MQDDPDVTSGLDRARRLVRAARSATLATVAGGQPHAALVTMGCTGDLSVVLLLSELSQHTRELRTHGICALLCTAPPLSGLGNPQTIERVSLHCAARPDADATLRARFLALHPYAALYAGFGDFHIWRLTIELAHFVGGFAQAASFEGTAIRPDPAIAGSIAAAEAEILAHCNADHAGAMAAIGQACGGVAGAWRLIGVDPDGCDLFCEDAAARAAWPFAVHDLADLRRALSRLAHRDGAIRHDPARRAGMAGGPPVS